MKSIIGALNHILIKHLNSVIISSHILTIYDKTGGFKCYKAEIKFIIDGSKFSFEAYFYTNKRTVYINANNNFNELERFIEKRGFNCLDNKSWKVIFE